MTSTARDSRSKSHDLEWLSANRRVFIKANIPVDDILDDLISSSNGSLFYPAEDKYQVICAQLTQCGKVRAFLNALSSMINTVENTVPLFKAALTRCCKPVLLKCSEPHDNLQFLRCCLDQVYVHDDSDENPFGWLDAPGDKPYQYFLNTCILEQAEAEKLMSSRNATSKSEQDRRDYLYSRPHQSQLVQMENLFTKQNARDDAPNTAEQDVGDLGRMPYPIGQSFPSHRPARYVPGGFYCHTSNAKRVGIYAPAGCGKTSCSIKVTSLYTCGELWGHFRLLLFWQLRDPAVQKAEELWQLIISLLPHWSDEQCRQAASTLLATNGRNVLLVFDGVDEFAGKENAFVRRLLAGEELQQAYLFVTSRPCALAKTYFQTYDLNLEMLGFTDQQVSQFVHTRLGGLATLLNNFLEQNPQLASLMPVPLLALFVCEVFRMAPNHPPKTRTQLYSKLLALIVRRAVSEKRVFIPDAELDDVMATVDANKFQGKARSLLIQLSNLARLAHQADIVIFDRQLVKQAKCSDEALQLGLVTSKSGRVSAQYSFLHLTFQEFLVAFAIIHHIQCHRICSEDVQQPSTECTQDLPSSISPARQVEDEILSGTMHTKRNVVSRFLRRASSGRKCARQHIRRTGISQPAIENALCELMRDLLGGYHHSVVLQFLAGLLPEDLLHTFFTPLNQWVHADWKASNFLGEDKDEADSRRRLLTSLECLQEAEGDKNREMPYQLKLPNTVALHHTTAADISVLAKALNSQVKELHLSFDKENEKTDNKPNACVEKQIGSVMSLLMVTLKNTDSVQEFYIDGPQHALFDMNTWQLVCQAAHCTCLNTLVMFLCVLGDSEIVQLAKSLRDNDHLIVLSLGYNRIGDKGVRELAASLQSNHTLKQLVLCNNRIGNEGAQELAVTLRSNHTLTRLSLEGNRIGDGGVHQVAVALQVNHTLTQLNLDYNRISNKGGHELAIALRTNNTLTQLNLGGNSISDKGAREFAITLQSNNMLTHLNLRHNKISDQGACDLAAAMRSNQTVTKLYLDSNRIRDEGAHELADALQSNHTLRQLWLIDNSYGESSQELLCKLTHIEDLLV